MCSGPPSAVRDACIGVAEGPFPPGSVLSAASREGRGHRGNAGTGGPGEPDAAAPCGRWPCLPCVRCEAANCPPPGFSFLFEEALVSGGVPGGVRDERGGVRPPGPLEEERAQEESPVVLMAATGLATRAGFRAPDTRQEPRETRRLHWLRLLCVRGVGGGCPGRAGPGGWGGSNHSKCGQRHPHHSVQGPDASLRTPSPAAPGVREMLQAAVPEVGTLRQPPSWPLTRPSGLGGDRRLSFEGACR